MKKRDRDWVLEQVIIYTWLCVTKTHTPLSAEYLDCLSRWPVGAPYLPSICTAWLWMLHTHTSVSNIAFSDCVCLCVCLPSPGIDNWNLLCCVFTHSLTLTIFQASETAPWIPFCESVWVSEIEREEESFWILQADSLVSKWTQISDFFPYNSLQII